jgi:hypothetical protein
MFIRISAAAAMAMSLTACLDSGDPADLGEDEAALVPSNPVPLPGRCPPTSCGIEQAKLDPGPWFHELNQGVANAEGIELVSITAACGAPMRVVDDRVTFVNWADGWRPGCERGADEARIHLRRGHARFTVRIADITWVDYRVNPSTRKVPYYLLMLLSGGEQVPLCHGGPNGHDPSPVDTRYATLFAGDRYVRGEEDTLSVTMTSPTGWFNVACAGSLISEMHRNRHTSASAAAPDQQYWTDLSVRQTFLNSLMGSL